MMNTKEFQFGCGCRFPILEERPNHNIPLLDIDINKIPFCDKAFKLLSSGKVKGTFQCETPLGRAWARKQKPETPDHVGALGAILRPGPLQSKDEQGISMTAHYCLRKNGEEEIPKYHPIYDDIVKETYGCLIYQEQCLLLAQKLAGFSLVDADSLRRSIGKKDASQMAKVEIKFVEGCEKTGLIDSNGAKEIFGWIKESQRFSFNKSHSQSYGMCTYETAYLKAHDPLSFFTAWLKFAKGDSKPNEEIQELVDDAKLFNIDISLPHFKLLNKHFIPYDGKPTFGFTNIKNVGDSVFNKIIEAVKLTEEKLGRKVNEWSWLDFLIFCSPSIPSRAVEGLISAGAFNWTGLTRSRMLFEYQIHSKLTVKEQEWLQAHYDKYDSFEGALAIGCYSKKDGGFCHGPKRVPLVQSELQLLRNPPTSLDDFPDHIAYMEQQTLGIPLTFTKVDSCNKAQANCTCKEFINGYDGYIAMAVEIREAREWKTKNGNKICYLSVFDSSCALSDIVVFSKDYEKYSGLLTIGNTVLLTGERSQKNDGLVVKGVYQLN